MFIFKKHKKISIFIISLILFIIVFSSIHISLFSDEGFTLGLIRNNYLQLIKIDSLDVHPPLYYILLKLFLSLTTFWTNNFIVTIIFSRLFSFIMSFITFVVLHNILRRLKLNNSLVIEFIIFLLLGFIPFVFIPVSNFLIIRMYPLAALFITLQFLEIIKFNNNNNNKHLFFILLLSLGAFYTHYISAIIAGSLLLILFFKYLFLKDKNSLKIMLVGITTFILYIPWILVAIKQVIYLSNGSWWMDYKYFIINIIFITLFMILFYLPIFLCKKHLHDYVKKEILYLNISILFSLIIILIISLLGNPMFQAKYMYPILLLYVFISMNILIRDKNHLKYILYLIVLLLSFGNLYNASRQIVHYNLSTVSIIKEINSIKDKKILQLRVPNNSLSNQSESYTIIVYCKYSDKFVTNYKELLNPDSSKKMNENDYNLYKNVYFGNEKYK